jgi:hypothetical protein
LGDVLSYKSGEIYFVREFQSGSKSLTPFVKIGLVASPRVSQERLLEHQTGNPRQLTIPKGHVTATEAVSMVEAQLHRRFAKFRVGGEWFRFETDRELSEAITSSRELALEAESLIPVLHEAERLAMLPSTGELIPATDEILKEANSLALSKKLLKTLEKTDFDIKSFLEDARKKGEDVGGSAEVQLRKFKPKFQEAEFAENYPDIYDEFLLEESKWEGRFLLKVKADFSALLGETLSGEIAAVESMVAEAIASRSITDLGESILASARLAGLLDWDIALAASRIKVACGQAPGIEEVCTWKRFHIIRKEFDSAKFVTEHPDLYTSYLSDAVTKEYVLPAKGSKRR